MRALKPVTNLRRKISRFLCSQSCSPTHISNKRNFLDNVDAFLFDCDGVIWKGESVIEGANATLEALRRMGKKVYFVTNNSTLSRSGFLHRFNRLRISAEFSEILSSSFAAALYFKKNPLAPGKKVYVIGHDGVGEELSMMGIPHLGGTKDASMVADLGRGGKVDHDRDVGAVVVGFDKNINYYKIQYAQLCLNENDGCQFIATNMDALAHCTDAQEWAAGGSMVGAIKGCTHKQPILVGKPAPYLIDYIIDHCGIPRNRICMVGDRLDTDMLFGKDNGLQTVLTLSGVTTREKMNDADESCRPDCYIASIRDILGDSQQ